MKTLYCVIYVVSLVIRCSRRGGVNALIVENMALRKQLIVLSRRRERCSRLSVFDRVHGELLVKRQ